MTRKQKKLLDFIRTYQSANEGVAPSFDEMKCALGLRSKSGIHRLILALEHAGQLCRLPHRARAIQILTPSDRPLIQAAFTGLTQTLSANLGHVAPMLSEHQRTQINEAFADFQRLLFIDENLLAAPAIAKIASPGSAT